jgi:hypothetical protein
MSKAAAPCSSCPSSKSEPSGKNNFGYTPTIECVLEDVVPVNTDSVVKVKHFKRFLNYDLKTLNINGKLHTYSHSNGLRETKMIVSYQDKKTNKVNYLEIDVIDNIIKKVESTIKKAENTSKQSRDDSGCPGPPPDPGCILTSCTAGTTPDSPNSYWYCPTVSLNGVVSTVTDILRTGEIFVGKQVLMDIRGKQCKVFSIV